jgi:hypothetical protein
MFTHWQICLLHWSVQVTMPLLKLFRLYWQMGLLPLQAQGDTTSTTTQHA